MKCKGCENRQRILNNLAEQAKKSWEHLIGKSNSTNTGAKQPVSKTKRANAKAGLGTDSNKQQPEPTDIGVTGSDN